MNWYHMIIGAENRVANCFRGNEEELFGRDSFELKFGNRIDDWNPQSELRSGDPSRDGTPDDVLANALGWPVFSRRLVDALTAGAIGVSDVQFLPIRVSRSTGETIPGFVVANVIARIPALDISKSKLVGIDEDETDPLTGQLKIVGLGKAALKSAVVDGHDIVRLTEFFPPIFVSQRFVEAFNRAKFTGVTFSPVMTSVEQR